MSAQNELFWLDISAMFHSVVVNDPDSWWEDLNRLQLLLDLAEAAKAAEADLVWELSEPI